MSEKLRATGKAVAWATAGAIGATAITGIAFAGVSGTIPATTVQTHDGGGMGGPGMGGPGKGHGPRDGQLQGRMMHGELVVKDQDGKAVTVAVQNGEVTAVEAGSVTVKSEDGFTKTWKLTDDTVIRSGRDEADTADLTVGVTVHIGSGDSGDTSTAARVHIRPADEADMAPPGAGTGGAAASPTLFNVA